jgi:hypothetical protein
MVQMEGWFIAWSKLLLPMLLHFLFVKYFFQIRYLLQNSEWLKEHLDSCGDDDFVMLDCPGQIELYSHLTIMHDLVHQITMWGYFVSTVFVLDALYVLEPSKFISGCMLSLSCMLQLETPYMNIVTKCDIADKDQIKLILDSENISLINNIVRKTNNNINKKFNALTEGICSVIDNYMMLSFVMLDNSDEESIENVLQMCDHITQYGEDLEPKEPVDDDYEREEEY